MRRGTLAAAIGILAVVCSSCAGSSHGSAAGRPGTTQFGPGGTSSGSGVLAVADQSRHVAGHLAGEREACAWGLWLRGQLDDLPWEC